MKPGAPEFWTGKTDEHVRKVAQIANQLQKGQGNNSFTKTLNEAPATTTEILVTFAKSNQSALLSPQTAEAAMDFALGTTYATVEEGKIVIHHAADSGARRYGVILVG